MALWLSVIVAAAARTAVVRWRMSRLHAADWERELQSCRPTAMAGPTHSSDQVDRDATCAHRPTIEEFTVASVMRWLGPYHCRPRPPGVPLCALHIGLFDGNYYAHEHG